MIRQLILASSSPRRKDLLEFLGVPFEIKVSDFPEEEVDFTDFNDPLEYVSTIAMGKALVVADLYPDALILAADTCVFLEGLVYGKPRDLDDARHILKTLRGKTHQVITGFVVIDTMTQERLTGTVESFVEFYHFSDEELERYIETSESLGKAGAYAIQRGAKGFVRQIQGSLSNIVGLPLTEVADLLENFGVPIDVDVREIEEIYFRHSV